MTLPLNLGGTSMSKLAWRWRCDVCGDWIEIPSHAMVLWTAQRAMVVHHATSGRRCMRTSEAARLEYSWHLDQVYGGEKPDLEMAVGFALWVQQLVGGEQGTLIALRLLVRGMDEALPDFNRFADWSGIPTWQQETGRITPDLCAEIVSWANDGEGKRD